MRFSPASLELKVPPVIVFAIAVGTMLLLSRLTPSMTAPLAHRIALMAILLIPILGLAIPAFSAFSRNDTTLSPTSPSEASTLIHSGVYRISRNPLYLALFLLLLACAVFLSNLPALLALPVFALYMTRFQIIPEERVLHAKFGDDYMRYMQSVRRWL